MTRRAARGVRRASMLALVCALLAASHAAPAAAPQIFDEAALGMLLQHIREFDTAMRQSLDGSTAELLSRLPQLWRELQRMEGRLQRTLPALREHLEALERELRNRRPPPAQAAGTFMV
ncbi:MAG: hypothetical protein AB7I32_17660 [Gammaproteobacteria bacterium]